MDGTERPGDATATDAEWPHPSQGWYAMVVFCLALMFSQLDLGIINLLVAPIKRDLSLDDFQMSLLLGFAFIVFYTFIGLPLSRFVDTKTRKYILAAGIAVWSVATAGCGLAQNFVQLFMARVMIGAGESINGPATYSMITDFFPREKLARPFAVLQIGFISGQGLSLLLGAFVIQMLVSVPDVAVPVIGTIRNWPLVFFFIGLPGLLVAAMMMTVREPPRHGRLLQGAQKSMPMTEVVKYLLTHRAVFGPMFIGLAFSAMNMYGVIVWSPSFLQRTYGWSAQQAGVWLGIVNLIAAPLGLVVGTWLNGYFTRRGHDDTNLRVLIWAQMLRVPASILAFLMPTPALALFFAGIVNFSAMMGAPSQNAALQIITPNEMRGQVTALYLFMFSVIGSGLGPSTVAAITDYLLHSESQVGYALAISSGVLGPLSAFIVWMGVRPYARTIARLRLAGA